MSSTVLYYVLHLATQLQLLSEGTRGKPGKINSKITVDGIELRTGNLQESKLPLPAQLLPETRGWKLSGIGILTCQDDQAGLRESFVL